MEATALGKPGEVPAWAGASGAERDWAEQTGRGSVGEHMPDMQKIPVSISRNSSWKVLKWKMMPVIPDSHCWSGEAMDGVKEANSLTQ